MDSSNRIVYKVEGNQVLYSMRKAL
ncbi:MAG: hypothetical protein FWG30_07130 [Eubacteriaceae bacterium]|nr:hypothetical protein [Eubacteriaceae bacterium]